MALLTGNFDPLTSPANMTTDVAIVSFVSGGERLALGVTKGGAGFKPGTKHREAEYDGKRHRATRTVEPIEFGASIDVTLAEYSEKTMAAAMPGSTVAAGVRTPREAGLALDEGDMLDLVWYQLPLKGGESLVFEFDKGLLSEFSIDTKDKDEATMKVTIDAYVDSTRPDYSSKLPDYRMFRLDALGNVITG